ncbi:MAG: hypothetical protein ABWK15_04930 [Dissulfuribacterales bacterium]
MSSPSIQPRTCISPEGVFLVGLHQPCFSVKNLRNTTEIQVLGTLDGLPVENYVNFPQTDLKFQHAEEVFEISNPFPFWGATYILKTPADLTAQSPDFSFLPPSSTASENSNEDSGFYSHLKELIRSCDTTHIKSYLPRHVWLNLAQNARDAEILAFIATISCELILQGNRPVGLAFTQDENGRKRPYITDRELFEIVVNNPGLPNEYKLAMALKPGIQGANPIVGEYGPIGNTHVWEYLRANSYIPGGHYASNMAQDSVRYSLNDLTWQDMQGLRNLYYQRIYTQLAQELGISCKGSLEDLRIAVLERIEQGAIPTNTSTIWGWNYGFDYSPSGFRMNASHQQIHHQFAMAPASVKCIDGRTMPSYVVGDQVSAFIQEYEKQHAVPFFSAYLKAIQCNRRMDGRQDRPASLILYEDEHIMTHVPKAQRSQGEVQIMAKTAGNILELNETARESLNKAIYSVMKAFSRMGVKMNTAYEVSRRFDRKNGQLLFYCFLPRHPDSPGAFSERQERWITGHYPEDYAAYLRGLMKDLT